MRSDDPTSERVLCTYCAFANWPATDFCERCGAPIGTMATLDPLKQTLAEGWVFRQAVEGPPDRIVLVGIWILFLPGLFCLPMALLGRLEGADHLAGYVVYFVLSALIVYRATASYLRGKGINREAQDRTSGPPPRTRP